jgi:hypothetical protein
LRVPVGQLDVRRVCHDIDRRVLLAPPRLCFLNVGEIGAQVPRQLAGDGHPGAVGDQQHDVERRDADVVCEPDVE